jgi:uncharacterized protein
MSKAAANLAEVLRTVNPVLNHGVYVFASVSPNTALASIEPIATFRENEGLTLIVEEQQAKKARLSVLFRAAWITLTAHSDLQAVGLTAAVATALAEANISCNVVAAAHHDHLFVPIESASQALAVLRALQEQGGSAGAFGPMTPFRE